MTLTDKELVLLRDLDSRLVSIVKYAKKIIPFTLIETYRSNERQQELFLAGKSKAKPGESKHNIFPSFAFDAVPEPLDWNDTNAFSRLNGVIQAVAFFHGIPIKLGSDFKSFKDMPHYELETSKKVVS